MKMVK